MRDVIIRRSDLDIEVAAEINRAKAKFGDQLDFTDGDWLAVLTEEVGEAATETLRAHHLDPAGLLRRSIETGIPIEETDFPLARLRKELVQVAAVAYRWVAAIDSRLLAVEAAPTPAIDRRARFWHAYGDPCADCGLVRFNVVHEMDPENSPEGPEYHADFAHHPFAETDLSRYLRAEPVMPKKPLYKEVKGNTGAARLAPRCKTISPSGKAFCTSWKGHPGKHSYTTSVRYIKKYD